MAMKLPPPKILTLNVTSSCDAACRYCHWWKSKGTFPEISVLLEAIDQAADMGVQAIRLSGGEPMLRHDLPEIVRAIYDRDLVSMVCTAAKDEPSHLFEIVSAGLDILSISIDLVDAELFKQLRGYAIEPVLNNLEALASHRRAGGFEIVISAVLTRMNVDHLQDLLELAARLNLIVSFTPFQDGTPSRRSPMTPLAFRAEDRPRIEAALKRVKEAREKVRIINSDHFLDGFTEFLIERRLPANYVCRAGESGAILTVEGNLKLCHSLEPLSGGTIAAQWQSAEAASLRGRMARLECPKCWLSCHADVRSQSMHQYGRTAIWSAL
jgi:MoaA/NifB/PqqE/SkfB family radical SAM enzyme